METMLGCLLAFWSGAALVWLCLKGWPKRERTERLVPQEPDPIAVQLENLLGYDGTGRGQKEVEAD